MNARLAQSRQKLLEKKAVSTQLPAEIGKKVIQPVAKEPQEEVKQSEESSVARPVTQPLVVELVESAVPQHVRQVSHSTEHQSVSTDQIIQQTSRLEQQIQSNTQLQLERCQQLLEKQLQSSKQLLEQKTFTSLPIARQVVEANSFRPLNAQNLRPRSTETGRVLFSFQGQRSTSNEAKKLEGTSLEEQLIIKKEVDVIPSEKLMKLMDKPSVRQILAKRIQRDTKLADQVLSALGEQEVVSVEQQ